MPPGKTPELRLTREQTRAVDRYAIEVLGIPGVVLMENAGRNAADCIARWRPLPLVRKSLLAPPRRQGSPRAPRVIVICGRGNNGGDGFVIARHLFRRGYAVGVDLLADPAELTGDAATNFAIIQKMNLPIRLLISVAPASRRCSTGETPAPHTGERSVPHAGETPMPQQLAAAARRWRGCDVLVDALLGTGFTGQVREPIRTAIAQINALRSDMEQAAPLSRDPKGSASMDRAAAHRPLVVAVDVPSGLDCDTGEPGGSAVRADHTVTFVAAKTGYASPAARQYLGRVTVADIGAPTELILQRLQST